MSFILLQFPKNTDEWLEVAQKFNDMWNFPNCGGAIDGKHVRITPPANCGSFYYNYKGFFSIVMMAVVNANYEFIYLDIGTNGRHSDASILERTEFFKRLQNETLHLPTNAQTVDGLNFVFIADDAFALGDHLLKPFPMRGLTSEQRIFNYRLSRARRVVENAFGILANRFRIFQTAINLAMYKIDTVVLACCILHNYLRRHVQGYVAAASEREPERHGRTSHEDGQERLTGLTSVDRVHSRLPTQSARQSRMDYMHYFNGIGSVSWQNDM